VLALKEHLANEVDCMRTAAEATMDGVKSHRLRESEHCAVVVARIVKHKVADSKWVNTKLLNRFTDHLSYPLPTVGAC
jgi:hypothetical protein